MYQRDVIWVSCVAFACYLSGTSPWAWRVISSVFGIACGLGFGTVYMLYHDKAMFKSIVTSIISTTQDKLIASPQLVGVIIQIVKPANDLIAMITSTLNGTEKKAPGAAQLINGKVMRIPFTYRQKKWKVYVRCDTEQEDSETSWLADGKNLRHCPMFLFDVTAADLGVGAIVKNEEEEIMI